MSDRSGFAGIALAQGRMLLTVRDGTSPDPVLLTEHPVAVPEPEGVVDEVARVLAETADLVGGLRGVGLSVGGHISDDGQRVVFAPGLVQAGHDWTDVPVADLLTKASGLPAVAENDVNCMCAYEQQFGVAAGVEDFVVVYLAPDVQGLGCAIVARGQLIRGATGGAGEFGHIVIQPEGPLCRCGNRGCLEAMLVVTNFDRDMNWGGVSRSSGFAEAAALLGGPHGPRAERVFERSGRYLGQGLATALNLLNPKMIVLGGPTELVGHADESDPPCSQLFMKGVHEAMEKNSFSSMARDCEVVVDRLDLPMAAAGAAILVQRGLDEGRLQGGAA
jgi:predicted NBD/HSP70 family sugar kinase